MSNTTQQMKAAIMPSSTDHSAPDSIKPSPSAMQSKKSSGNEDTDKKPASLDEGGETTVATSKSSKRSTRSSTRDFTSFVSTKKRSRSSDEAANRARPKRRAASSVRFGSYKEVENVDFSLLEHFYFDSASPARSSKKKSPVKSSASVVSSKKSSPTSLKRSSLLVSAQSSQHPLAESEQSSAAAPASKIFEMPKQKTAKKISGAALERLLPPVLLSRSKDGYAAIPKFLQDLKSSNGKVEIFNRKTGKIMKGSQSVSLKSLANELQAHSEYEPICPEYSRTSSPSSPIYRQARTSTTARVSEQVQPQSRLRASKVVGRNVLITGGSHKGLFGKIDSCIPGNWYVLSNVFKDDPLELEIVVHSRDLKLVNGGTKEATRSTSETESAKYELEKAANKSYAKPVTKTIEALGLRVDALEEQKIKLVGALVSTRVGQEGSLPPAARILGQELQSITQRITKARSELQKYKLVRNVLVGRGLNGKSRTK